MRPLRALLQAVKDQLFFRLQVGGEFFRIRKAPRRQAICLLQGMLQDLQAKGLVPFGIGTVHPAHEAERVVS